MGNVKKILTACVVLLWAALALYAWVKPTEEISVAERRRLAQRPVWSGQRLRSGAWMEDFGKYSVDQFPLRDPFRRLKARFHYGVLRQKDNNGIALVQGSAMKLEYPLDTASVDHMVSVLDRVYEKYIHGTQCNVYQAVVPDKGYYLAQPNGYPSMDYGMLMERMETGLPWAKMVVLTDCLTAQDYYRTDTHWRQEQLLPVAQRLCAAMGAQLPQREVYSPDTLELPFYGVYHGQAALPMDPDRIVMMRSPLLEDCKVYHYEDGRYTSIYDMEKRDSRDLYDIYLSGAAALQRIEVPGATTDRELVVFRDSFGSSVVPLLVQGYGAVTLVDLRYVSSDLLGQFLHFHDQDVLFLYSTLVINASGALK